jgi:metallo-beta-lactamase family protein
MITATDMQHQAKEPALHLDTSPIHIKGILVATDMSDQSTKVLKISAHLARQLHARLHVLHAIPPQVYVPGGAGFAPVLQEIDLQQAEVALQNHLAKVGELRTLKHEEIVVSDLVTDLPIIRDPDPAPIADYLIMESTYGDRLHQPEGPVKQKLAGLVKRVTARGGHIIVPAFAVGRTQQLVLLLHELIEEKQIPDLPILVDSPLAVNVTEVFTKHSEEWAAQARAFHDRSQDAFGWKRLHYVQSVEESKALNDLHFPFIVISASGMCEAGRILHHLKNGIEDSRNLILITGYQAVNTLGRKLVERQPEVNIFGEPMRLRAEVDSIGELSGHADQQELLDWMQPAVSSLKKVFLVHGEPPAQQALKATIEQRYGLDVICPARGDHFEVG